YLKLLNKKQVLSHIKKYSGNSRSEIAEVLPFSQSTISKIVDELLHEGWVTEHQSAKAHSSGNRKPMKIYFNKNLFYIVGVDIGGSSVEIALVNLEGEIIDKRTFPTQKYLPHRLLREITAQIHQLVETNNVNKDKIFGVGMGVPGITDIDNGVV